MPSLKDALLDSNLTWIELALILGTLALVFGFAGWLLYSGHVTFDGLIGALMGVLTGGGLGWGAKALKS